MVEEVVANIDIAPTVFEAAGIKTPSYMDGQSFIPLGQGKAIPWRDYFLYVYYWEKNFPQSPTVFALRGDRYKYITYYGLWDSDELYDIQNDPGETRNLIADAGLRPVFARWRTSCMRCSPRAAGCSSRSTSRGAAHRTRAPSRARSRAPFRPTSSWTSRSTRAPDRLCRASLAPLLPIGGITPRLRMTSSATRLRFCRPTSNNCRGQAFAW
ncbi:MAG: hypothetical protein CM1200mP34_3070 [Verrucomicrobiales bacterium]|nr:MAG: hypothetical protein CM1200mP34_3070 [Verrucomicrobiales bacterium]